MKKLLVKCPTCAKKHDYYQSKPWSPFCSERCRLIDLGAWASEAHKINGKPISMPEKNPLASIDPLNINDFLDQDDNSIN